MAAGLPKLPRFLFIVQETDPPFAVAIVGLTDVAREHTTQKIVRAFHAWKGALAADAWPGYPRRVIWAEPPPWELKREEHAMLAATVMQSGL
jgi:hypothetical protein